jgi:hypothetical protein
VSVQGCVAAGGAAGCGQAVSLLWQLACAVQERGAVRVGGADKASHAWACWLRVGQRRYGMEWGSAASGGRGKWNSAG